MTNGFATYISRKQIGVIYSNNKRGNLHLEDEIVSWLYNSCAECRYNYNNVNAYLDDVKAAIDMVFSNKYAEAEAAIRRAFATYNRKFK